MCDVAIVMRERARSREDHARAVRGTLKNLSIDTSNLKKGNWLTLACSELVQAEASAAHQNCDSTSAAAPATDATTHACSPPTVAVAFRGDDDKIITLTSHGQNKPPALAVTKDG